MKIASWNIEKNGQASVLEKQSKVEEFIWQCCKKMEISILFLCEVHSARLSDYVDHLAAILEDYHVVPLDGGKSNCYVILIRTELGIQVSHDSLKGLNREAVFLQTVDNSFSIILAHFKSGQTGLTKNQLIESAQFAESVTPGKWIVTGDMNWDYGRFDVLELDGTKRYTCWLNETQKKGGILDWCLAGKFTDVTPIDLTKLFLPSMFDMEGHDHKPVIFTL